MALRAVFFDLDGTLLDTAPDLAKALNHLLRAKGKDPLPLNIIRRVVSDGAYALLQLGFGVEKNDAETEELRSELLQFYLQDLSSETHPFPGINQLIETLHQHNIDWGIATNKPWTYTEPLMQRYEFARAPSCVICPDHVQHRKPHPEALQLACSQTGCDTQEAIYVGDHLRDIQCGQRAGMPTIAVGYGYISSDDSHLNWNADYVVDSAEEIWPIVRSYI
ncbi:Phosphoglycolate phosphatase [Thalassocella blandensis]|nr:Phosphoglycolate phosphatase [Thalassocella blandensis]